MILALLATAFATPRLAVVDGPLQPGRAAWVELADDAPGAAPREVVVRGGALRTWVAVRPGVWRAVLVPSVGASAVELAMGGSTVQFPLTLPPRSALSLPEQVDGSVGAERVDVPVTGFGGGVEDLQVDLSEGSAQVERAADGLVIRVTPDPLVHPRWILVAARDRRSGASPVVSRIRLRSRPRIPLRVEPGVSLQLEVGGRAYGPFVADASGAIDGRVDQFPGESAALAVFTDVLGNVTRTEIPLVVETESTLVAAAGEALLPGRPPPLFHLAAVTPVGAPAGAPPTCLAPFGQLPLREDGPGRWYGALPPLVEPQDVRVVCTLGGRQAGLRIPVAPVPARISMRVWPEELRADFPTAEVRVSLEDHRGERLPVDRVSLEAELGHVEPMGADPELGRSEYDGATAVAAGRDSLVARYHPPPGDGPPVELELGWTAVTPAGFTLHARVLDALRRPLGGVPLQLAAGDEAAEVVTDGDGWASLVAAPELSGPVPVGASCGGGVARLERRGFVLPREPAFGGPSAGLTARVDLTLRPGRVAGLDVDVEPPVLRAGPGAVAWVVVRLEDGLGQPVVDEPVTLEASEGTVGDLHQRPDGSMVAEYQPLAVSERREVQITASTSTVHGSARLLLEPRVVRFSLGPWVGGITTFGSTIRPVGGVDLDARLRSPLLGEALMVRLGVWVSPASATVSTGVGPPAEIRSTSVPGTFALLLRDDRGPWSVWGGAGFALGVQHLEARFGSAAVATGNTWLFGPELHAAVARRAPGGEVSLGLRGTWLQAPESDVGFSGNLGGVSGTLGYRVVW